MIILEIKFYKEAKRGRTGKWAKRLRGERESRRNDPGGRGVETARGERESGRNDSGANGNVGETTRILPIYQNIDQGF